MLSEQHVHSCICGLLRGLIEAIKQKKRPLAEE